MFSKSVNIAVSFILILGMKVFASDASLLEFAEGFLPASVSGSFYEAVFSRDKARVWY